VIPLGRDQGADHVRRRLRPGRQRERALSCDGADRAGHRDCRRASDVELDGDACSLALLGVVRLSDEGQHCSRRTVVTYIGLIVQICVAMRMTPTTTKTTELPMIQTLFAWRPVTYMPRPLSGPGAVSWRAVSIAADLRE
jgi:hypothetical protein